MSQANSLIFIPDISGFTRFVNRTEEEHSGHIIAELLEILIDSNQLDMTLAEIEGDALFYYKHLSIPSLNELMAQIEQMFIRFHSHLKRYEHQRICQCGACSTANQLTLKFIIHAGPIDFIQIKDLRKPYGKEVITAHRLMKNNVPNDEYVLFTHSALAAMQIKPTSLLHDSLDIAQTTQNTYEDIGVVSYDFLLLGPLKSQISAVPTIPYGKEIEKPYVGELFIPQAPETVFPFIIDFKNRHLWNKDVDSLEYDEQKVNRAGTLHNCLIEHRELKFETVKSESHPEETYLYGERTADFPLGKELTAYFILKSQDHGTRLRIELHPNIPPLLRWLFSPIIRFILNKQIHKLLNDIKNSLEASLTSQSHSPPELSEF
ncbi:MAG: DUF2652 domain-containing protein [Bacteroidota bacterium]